MSDTTATHASPQTDHDADYAAFERLIAERVAAARGPLFTTDATGLFEAYLAGISGESNCSIHQIPPTHSGPRQHYNCRYCRLFIERYGGLVYIEENGTRPVLWDGPSASEFFKRSAAAMAQIVLRAKVTGVFVNGEATWGMPFNVAGKGSKCEGTRWTHLHGIPSEFLHPICNGIVLVPGGTLTVRVDGGDSYALSI